jgi:hypothetical protein
MRYYFHSEFNGKKVYDQDGTEAETLDTACRDACRLAATLLQESAGEMSLNGAAQKLCVTDGPDGEGRVVFKIEISAASRT